MILIHVQAQTILLSQALDHLNTLIFQLEARPQTFLWFLLPIEAARHRKMHVGRLSDRRFSWLIDHTFSPFGRIRGHLTIFDACELAPWDWCADSYWFLMLLSLLIWWNLAHWCRIQLFPFSIIFILFVNSLIFRWHLQAFRELHAHRTDPSRRIFKSAHRRFCSENWFTLGLSQLLLPCFPGIKLVLMSIGILNSVQWDSMFITLGQVVWWTHLVNLCPIHIIILLQIEVIFKIMETDCQARLVVVHLRTEDFIGNCALLWVPFSWYGRAWSWLVYVSLNVLCFSSCCRCALLSHLSTVTELVGNFHIVQIIMEIIGSAELRQGLPELQIDIALAYDLWDVCCITEFLQILSYWFLNLTSSIQVWSDEALALRVE